MDIFEIVIESIIGLAISFSATLFVIKIAEVVQEHITRFNIGRITKKVLEEDSRTCDLLKETIELAIREKNGNTVSLSALKEGKKVADIQLKGESVAEDIKVGEVISLMVAC